MRMTMLALAIVIVVSVSFLASHEAIPLAAQESPLDACAAILATYAPVVGTDSHPTPLDAPLPPVREAWRDPAFGTCVVRVTDRFHDFGTPLTGLKNEYSRVQAYNADNTLMMARSAEGDWFLYDAATLAPIQRLDAGIAIDEPRWDAQNPHRFTFSQWYDAVPRYMFADLIPGGNKFDVQISLAHDFAGELPPEWNATFVWRRWEGSPSSDGQYDAFMVEDQDFITRGLITYDWTDCGAVFRPERREQRAGQREHLAARRLRAGPVRVLRAGHAGYVRGPVRRDGLFPGSDEWPGDRTPHWPQRLALDVQGREVVVYQEIDTDQIVMADLETGLVTPLLDLDFSTGVYGLHISGRSVDRPGWAAVSVQPEAPSLDFSNPFWMVGTVFAVELKANPRVVQLAHHHSIRSEAEADYFAEPQVTANRDFTRLLFTSNWGNYGTGEVELYLVVLPDDWTDRLP
jgi:hypothetical protein